MSVPGQVPDSARQGGFARAELLAVMIVCGLLLAVAVPWCLSGAAARARQTSAEMNVGRAATAIEAYYAETGTYRTLTLSTLGSGFTRGLQGIALGGLTDSSYCVSATAGGKTYRKQGPGASIVQGRPCA